MAADIKDTTGFYVDDTLDDEGGGAYSLELNSGSTPNKKALRVDDDKLETIDLTDPAGLADGVQIKVSSNGTEISRTEYDNRQRAQLVRITREYNTLNAERNNGRVDGVTYPAGAWQSQTIEDVVRDICLQTYNVTTGEQLLVYGGGAPADFAGEVVFKNTAAPQAISEVLAKQGNTLWTVDPADGKTVLISERVLGGPAVGIIAKNVMEQSLTGADVTSDRPAIVTDKAGRGLKTQYGGPAYVGLDAPDGETFGAPAPLPLKIDLSGLKAAATKAGKASIDDAYGYKFPNATGEAGWQVPRDAAGKIIKGQARLVQAGVIADDLVTRTGTTGKAYQSDLLTHPNLKLAFEAKVTGAPAYYKYAVFPAADIAERRAEYEGAITAAAGRITKEIAPPPANSQRPAELYLFEATFTRNGEAMVAMAIFALFKPEWRFVDGYVDMETGELVIDAGDKPDFSRFVSTGEGASLGAGISMGFTEDPTQHPLAGPENPMPFIQVTFTEAAIAAEYRAHVVTVEELGPFTSPSGAAPPYGATQQVDGEKHNVILNAARVDGYFEPTALARDDSANMQLRADNLAKSLLLPSMAKGNIKIFPGDESLYIGQPANGGVITKIKHSYVPFFVTTFWLEGSPDIDNPEQQHARRKIGEFEGLTQVNSASIVETSRRTDSASRVQAASKVAPHNHADDESGGAVFGDVSVAGLTIIGTLPNGQPNMKATRGGLTGIVDLKWLNGMARLVSGDLLLGVTAISGTKVEGRVYDLPSTAPLVKDVQVLVNGKVTTSEQVARLIEVGGRYPLVFIEAADNDPPSAAIIAWETELYVDHKNADESTASQSTNIAGSYTAAGAEAEGDLDDLTLVGKKVNTTVGGSTEIVGESWMLYMAEREFSSDGRRLRVIGPHEKSVDRFARKQGDLADVLRYYRTDYDHSIGRLTVRQDANVSATRPRLVRSDEEGPLDYLSLHAAFDALRVEDGIKGAAIMFDPLDWSDAALGGAELTAVEKKRGQRYKVVPIVDHSTLNDLEIPTGGDHVNQSTMLIGLDENKGEGVFNLADFDDLTIVRGDNLWSLYMVNHHAEIGGADPHGVQGSGPGSGIDCRFGYIAGRFGTPRAFLSDLFGYRDNSATNSQLVFKSDGLFKHTDLGGGPVLVGPQVFSGPAAVEPVGLMSGEYLYGYWALDRTKTTKRGAKGEWYIETPFNACESSTIVAELTKLYMNDLTIKAILIGNDTSLAMAIGDLCDAVKAAVAALAAAISACACCFAEAPPIVCPEVILFEPLLEPPCDLEESPGDVPVAATVG